MKIYFWFGGDIFYTLTVIIFKKGFNFDSIIKYIEILENLLQFRNISAEYLKTVQLKISHKLIKCMIPSILSNLGADETQIASKKSLSAEWKKFLFLCIFSTLINTTFRQEITPELLGNAHLKSFLTKLINIEILSKTNLLKLDKDLPSSTLENIVERFSIFNGKYFQIMWTIYDYLLGEAKIYAFLKETNANIVESLIAKYKEDLELASPHCLASLVKSAKSLLSLVTSGDMRGKYHEDFLVILSNLYKLIWDIQQDVKNFNDSYNEFLDLIFCVENIAYDQDHSFKKFLMDVRFFS